MDMDNTKIFSRRFIIDKQKHEVNKDTRANFLEILIPSNGSTTKSEWTKCQVANKRKDEYILLSNKIKTNLVHTQCFNEPKKMSTSPLPNEKPMKIQSFQTKRFHL